MGDIGSIMWVTAAYSGSVGLLGVLAAYLLRRRSLRVATLMVALVAVAVFVASAAETGREPWHPEPAARRRRSQRNPSWSPRHTPVATRIGLGTTGSGTDAQPDR